MLARKPLVQIGRKVRVDPFRPEEVEAVAADDLAEGVVDSRFQGAGGHQLGQRRDRLGQAGGDGQAARRFRMGGGQAARNLQRMAALAIVVGLADQFLGQREHGALCLRRPRNGGRPRPDVAQGHGPEAAAAAAIAGFGLDRRLHERHLRITRPPNLIGVRKGTS